MSALIGALRVTLGLDSAAFEKGASAAEKRMAKMERTITGYGKSMTDLGAKLSLAVTDPLVAMGAAAVRAATESQQAIGQVETALASMGDAAGRTSEQLQDAASGIMRESLYDDDDILRQVTANMLTFGNVAEAQFDRAQQAAVDLAARMHMDLQSAALLVGKALNDPVKGMTALRRAGIQLTEQQQAQIKAMAAVGDEAGAQRILLSELEHQFGGSAKAMREADPMGALKQSWNDFLETVGAKLLPILPRITDAITGMLDAFGKLSPGMQQAVIVGAALAAAVGPLLTALGGLVQIAAPMLAFLQTMGALMASTGTASGAAAVAAAGFGSVLASIGSVLLPIVAALGAGYLAWKNWDKIEPVLRSLWKTVSETIGPPLQRLIDAVSVAAGELWQGPFGDAIRAAMPYIIEFGSLVARVFGSEVVITIKAMATAIGLAFDLITIGVKALTALFDGTFAKGIADAIRNVCRVAQEWLQGKLGAVIEWVKTRVHELGDKFAWLYDVVVGHSYIPDMVDGIAAHMARLDAVMVAPVTAATTAAEKKFRDMAGGVKAILDRLYPEMRRVLDFRADRATIEGSDMSDAAKQDALGKLLAEGRSAPDFGNAGGPLVDGMGDVSDALARLTEKAQIGTVKIAKSFKDMADDTLQSLQRLTSAIKGGGFLDILSSVIGLGLQLGGAGLFGKTIAGRINAVPGYASGTSFHPGGWAKVGERGPELVNLPRGSQVYPNGTGPGATVRIVPSPYFNAVVDGRAAAVAAPMSAAAAATGSNGAQTALARRNARRIP